MSVILQLKKKKRWCPSKQYYNLGTAVYRFLSLSDLKLSTKVYFFKEIFKLELENLDMVVKCDVLL